MPMLKDPSRKYKPFKPLRLPGRQWPDQTITKAPRWLNTDLRDGNQSLANPLDGEQKLRFFNLLVEIGYKEIEVSFPAASQIDFDFTRHLIETPNLVPEDVVLQVISPCRKDLIKRTAEALYGAKKVIFHLYLATSECFRRIVFNNMTEDETLNLAVECTKLVRSLTKDSPDPAVRATEWQYQFTPETFSDTSLEYSIKLCNAVREAWEPITHPIIFNLPATVELSTPNVYADQIEYFCKNISEREKVCVSLHPHNDRGCAVAASELAQMAGADRVEGCLFGNGERTGNVDLVTLALNLYTQGISPGIDFSDISKVISTVEDLTKIPVHPRQPYGGQFAVCAFSGSHQDAIKKGFQSRKDLTDDDHWVMPYLPFDSQDIGRNYEAVIRVNSQSGKGGAAWIILQNLHLDIPKPLQQAFSKIVQKHTETVNRELQPAEIVKLFEEAYLPKANSPIRLVDYRIRTDRATSNDNLPLTNEAAEQQSGLHFEGTIALNGVETPIKGEGNGTISSLVNCLNGLGVDLTVNYFKEQAVGSEGVNNMKAAAYIECSLSAKNGGKRELVWGVGLHEDMVQAGLMALLSAASSIYESRLEDATQLKSATHPHRKNSAIKVPSTMITVTELCSDVD
ncbi:hypothetical protein TWF102_005303 [Orbilia oligospora]|uniref:2-isopropylmalate synthase n=1 Tax=Orbilia oligospora TaxID=2813651 RepID=A0A7C8JCH3_ORBOL|nr:hypothetical protein TWF102_005303 [Orbilia oligospora]KAF3101897.1 hypothetical protein TWF103_007879 [Orbilia oligospora]KAF3111679.1 hypothetical protein TWF706_011422 [Orbilia oligospora]KAF3133663.1 hypothetical protein TWF703_006720 [Orbilia oligospora]KAF3140031.1 hypothetical protein TWF594_006426 [Orbilia oligospora]